MTRLLYFTRDYTTHDHRFLTALAQTEHQVFYLQLERRGPILEERRMPSGIEFVNWAGGQRTYQPGDRSHLVADLDRVIQQVRPDLIQAGPLHLSAYLAACTGFRPLVSMSWGYDLLYEAPNNPKSLELIKYTLQHSAALVGDCDTIRRLAVSYGMTAKNIVTFPWGIDLQHFFPAKESNYERDSETFTLISTRGWEPIYGVEVLAKAFSQVAQKHPKLQLLMLADGSQANLLRQIFEQAGVLDQVSFPGQVGFAELPAYYRQADLYISASHSDGTSISLLEALACGLPALVSDIPGNREWITPGIQGWWFPDSSVEALSQAILHALQNRQQVQAMALAARRLAEERADWNVNFPHLFQAYEIALAAKNKSLDES